mmetsp:Transcript_37366/g.79283  ORF Transcript_37366/g.79283 Transcript_37366/m.79283 type:complete len:465 (-) Transcript_37366:29-1423(-)
MLSFVVVTLLEVLLFVGAAASAAECEVNGLELDLNEDSPGEEDLEDLRVELLQRSLTKHSAKSTPTAAPSRVEEAWHEAESEFEFEFEASVARELAPPNLKEARSDRSNRNSIEKKDVSENLASVRAAASQLHDGPTSAVVIEGHSHQQGEKRHLEARDPRPAVLATEARDPPAEGAQVPDLDEVLTASLRHPLIALSDLVQKLEEIQAGWQTSVSQFGEGKVSPLDKVKHFEELLFNISDEFLQQWGEVKVSVDELVLDVPRALQAVQLDETAASMRSALGEAHIGLAAHIEGVAADVRRLAGSGAGLSEDVPSAGRSSQHPMLGKVGMRLHMLHRYARDLSVQAERCQTLLLNTFRLLVESSETSEAILRQLYVIVPGDLSANNNGGTRDRRLQAGNMSQTRAAAEAFGDLIVNATSLYIKVVEEGAATIESDLPNMAASHFSTTHWIAAAALLIVTFLHSE